MSLFSNIKIELIKLYHKKSSLLLLLLLALPLFFGIGMMFGASFFVSDGSEGGVDAVSSGLSAIEFSANMLGQAKYVLFLVVIILAAISFAGEIENGQIKSEITRICARWKILLSKYFALIIVTALALIVFLLWTILIYYSMLRGSAYSNGTFWGAYGAAQIKYMVFMFIGAAVSIASTFILGLKLKTFPCFALSYILWFVSLYTDFFEQIKMLIPINIPDVILERASEGFSTLPYTGLFLAYCLVILILSAFIFERMDIRE